jgi:hypothetical protein
MMTKIIPLTKERIKKFNVFGCDVSVSFAKYAFKKATLRACYTTGVGWHSQPINYHHDHEELDGIITHRFILWRVKIDVKTVVQYDYSFT